MVALIIAILILGIAPFFIVLGDACSDLRDTNRRIKQNEADIRKMIYGR
jgi:hypothetical protein